MTSLSPDCIRSSLQDIFRNKLAQFGYILHESGLGIIVYHPDSLFFIRANSLLIEFGFAIKKMTFLDDIPEDLWRIKPISSCEAKDGNALYEFINKALVDYEDYALQVPLKYKVKEIFKDLHPTQEETITSSNDVDYYSDVHITLGEINVVISRDYWTRRLGGVIKISKNDKPNSIDDFAKSFGITKPPVDITSNAQMEYLDYVKNVVMKIIK